MFEMKREKEEALLEDEMSYNRSTSSYAMLSIE